MKNQILVNTKSVLIFRVMLSSIFLMASIAHLLNIDKTLERLNQARFKNLAYLFGDPKWLIILSGIIMFIAGLSLLVGYKTKWAALALTAVIIPITITVQVGQINTIGPLFKNIAILGGLLFFILNNFKTTQKQ
jgi:putative oxidoreductase